MGFGDLRGNFTLMCQDRSELYGWNSVKVSGNPCSHLKKDSVPSCSLYSFLELIKSNISILYVDYNNYTSSSKNLFALHLKLIGIWNGIEVFFLIIERKVNLIQLFLGPLITNRFIQTRHDIHTDIVHQALNLFIKVDDVIFNVITVDEVASENYFTYVLDLLAVFSMC